MASKKTGWKNQIKTTLPPKYQAMVEGDAALNNTSVSDVTRLAVKARYDAMPEPERLRLIEYSKHSY